MGKKEVNLSWDAFQSMGNPENAPDIPSENESEGLQTSRILRVFLDKKSRGGKVATIIRGFTDDDDLDQLKALGKKLKIKCGVGGAVKNNEIIIQGNHRDKVIDLLNTEGFKNVKKSGG